MLGRIRQFFARIGVVEVETPICSRHASTDPALESFATRYRGPGAARGLDLYLHTSPEFAMKRLLAAGSGPIYQICKVFRNGELGRRHNPEFSLLEWYRPGFDYHRLMDEVAQLVNGLTERPMPIEKLTYTEAFERRLGLNPHIAAADQLRECAIDQGVPGAAELDLENRDAWLDLLLTHLIEPRLGENGMTFIHDYPATQAALARVREGRTPVAERFELYCCGVELANGFGELTDPAVQRVNLEAQMALKEKLYGERYPIDEDFLAALAHMPPASGCALGFDRLVMLAAGATHIDQVLWTPPT
jgi:lysyl-tRNA synthetase class 2